MKCYCWKEDSQEFDCETDAPIDPLESELQGKEIYILPANATYDKPLEKKEHKAIVWSGKKWAYKPDWRNVELYNPETQEHKTLDKMGENKPEGFLEIKQKHTTGYYDIEVKDDGVYFVDRPKTKEEETEEVESNRSMEYASQIDSLHARKTRKLILGTWTDADESEYVEQVKKISAEIAERYPYPE